MLNIAFNLLTILFFTHYSSSGMTVWLPDVWEPYKVKNNLKTELTNFLQFSTI
jgi:hypothetical protein